MEDSSLMTVEIFGRQMSKKLFNTILKLACDIIVNGKVGAEFNVYGICTGKMRVDSMGGEPDYVPESGGEYRAQGQLDYVDEGKTTFIFYLPKEARLMQPLVESFEEINDTIPQESN